MSAADAAIPEVGRVRATVERSLASLERWIESHDYKAYEPFDGLSSSLRPLLGGNLFLERLLLQLIRQSPVNLRPLLGVKPLESTKGRGYMAAGYLKMFSRTGDRRYATMAAEQLDWLMANKSPRFADYTWANHFDFASRAGRYSRHEPIIVWTALVGQAFVDGYLVLADARYLDVARSVCAWIMALPRERTSAGTCISYHALYQSSIHNANMLGAAILARVGRLVGDTAALDLAREAMDYSCTRQRPDGSWYYAEEPRYHWIDNFHTGYNLDSLKCYIDHSGDERYRPNLERGFRYWAATFFDDAGNARYYHNRLYPIDSQCISQAIETCATFADTEASLALGCRIALRAIETMQDADGHFYYRRYPLMTAKAPMFHWAQATTYKALASLAQRLDERTRA